MKKHDEKKCKKYRKNRKKREKKEFFNKKYPNNKQKPKMAYENLIPKDLSKRKDHIELSRKGGLSKSPSKVLSSRINGLMNSKKLSGEQKYMLALLKNKKFIDLIIELISMNLEDINRPERRDKVIDQLSKFLPNRNLNMNYNKTEESNVLTAKDFSDAWKKIKEEESNQKSDKCDMIRD